MFTCHQCGRASRTGQMVVLETREKIYVEKRRSGNREYEEEVGRGHETVREAQVCHECIEKNEQRLLSQATGVRCLAS